MFSFLSPESLARFACRRPWTVVATWAVILVASLAFGSTIGGVLSTEVKSYQELEADRAEQLVEERLRGVEPAKEFVLVGSEAHTVDDQAFRDVADGLIADIRGLRDEVAAVVSYYETQDPALVAPSRHTLLIPVVLRVDDRHAVDNVAPILAVLARQDGKDGFTAVTGGAGSISRLFTETAASDLERAEVVGMPVALVVLIVVFGALVAAGVPLGLAAVAILVAVGVAAVVGRAFDLTTYVMNMITMIGAAVGIDYSLIVIQRFREERSNGLPRDAAIARAGGTASRAVLFSGLTVVIALCGLMIVPTSLYRSLAFGAIAVVVAAVAAALTLLPAVLRLLGDRVNLGRVRIPGHGPGMPRAGGFWSRTTGFVTGHAVLSIVASVALLLLAAVPYLGIRLGTSGITSLPHDSQAYRAFALLDSEFSAGLLTPTDVVVTASDVNAPEVRDALRRLQDALLVDPAFTSPAIEVNEAGDLALMSVAVRGESQSNEALDAVKRLRGQLIPAAFANVEADVFVGGGTAMELDFGGLIADYTPIVFVFVLGLSFVILLVVFRSLVVPVKAIIMNLLSVGASYGLMVLVFQEGVGAGLFGFQQVERIETWVPLFMFSVLFGLSMDYHVFLLTRIREHFDRTGDNLASVAYGVRTTAGLITGAALIMVAVFSGFAIGDLTMFQQMGFGLAVAVFLDATVVRTVLVPASMALLGDLNWYLPAWLDWLPRVRVEGTVSRAAPATRHRPVPAEMAG